jgi:hypothetical protein
VETTETVDPDTDTPRPLPWTPPVDNRAALEGILFVVRIGIPLERPAHHGVRCLGRDLLAAAEGMARRRGVAAAARDPAR